MVWCADVSPPTRPHAGSTATDTARSGGSKPLDNRDSKRTSGHSVSGDMCVRESLSGSDDFRYSTWRRLDADGFCRASTHTTL